MPIVQKKKPKRRFAITFSNRDFHAFLEAMEADKEPNDALKRAAERYRQQFGRREMSR
jgi:uncharacterized protein (DUF1778 family)